jgi:hypothetical protein
VRHATDLGVINTAIVEADCGLDVTALASMSSPISQKKQSTSTKAGG